MDRKQLLAALKDQNEKAQKLREVTLQGIGKVYLRDLTVAEVDHDREVAALLDPESKEKKSKAAMARGACKLIRDEQGTLLLDHENDADVALVSGLPWSVLAGLFAAQDKQNGINEEGSEQAKNA